jgi:hypothetical protein
VDGISLSVDTVRSVKGVEGISLSVDTVRSVKA